MDDLSADLDALRTIDTKFVRPLTKVMAVFDRAVAVRGQVMEAEKDLAALHAQHAALKQELDGLAKAAVERRDRANVETKTLQSQINTLREQLQEMREEGSNVRKHIELEWKEQRASLERDYTARKAALQAEMASMDADHKHLQDAITTLKARVAAIGGSA